MTDLMENTRMMLLLVILHCCLVGSVVASDLPTLSTKKSNLVIPTNSTLNITCSGEQPVEWLWPVNLSTDDDRISLIQCSEDDYCQTLVVKKVTANDTGMYICFYEGSNATSSVQVSIVDQSSPFVPNDKTLVVTIHGTAPSNETVTIPCLASRPDVNVTLRTKYAVNTFVPNGQNVQWHYQKGFTISSGLVRFVDMVFCETNVNGEIYRSSNFIIVVIDYTIYSLSITPYPQIKLAAGDRLELTCKAHTPLNVRVKYSWDYPSMMDDVAHSERDLKYARSEMEHLGTLIIKEATLKDGGNYSCTADTGGMNKTISTTVIVYEKPFIILDESLEKVFIVKSGDRVRIPVKFTAFPDPEAKWSKNGKLFSHNHKTPYLLFINECSEKDSGNYTVVLTNPRTRDYEKYSFQLIVQVPPHICEKAVSTSVESIKFGKRSTLTCTASGIPAPVNIQWTWQLLEECTSSSPLHNEKKNTYSCPNWRNIQEKHGGNTIEMHETRTDVIEGKIKTVSKLYIAAANISAIYKCSATNDAGKDEHIIAFLVTRELRISINPEGKLTERDDVTLSCTADRDTYEKPVWFKLHPTIPMTRSKVSCENLNAFRKMEMDSTIVNRDGVNITSELRLQDISLLHQGVYMCMAYDRKMQKNECSITELNILGKTVV